MENLNQIVDQKLSQTLKLEAVETTNNDKEQMIGNNYQLNFSRKISEFLLIRHLKPTLNVNEKRIT